MRMQVPSFVRRGLTCLGVCGAMGAALLAFPIQASAQTNFKLLHTFPSIGVSHPTGRIIQASDGNFYGTTSNGGPANGGSVFQLTPGGALTILHTFSFGNFDGGTPQSGLIQASDGFLYGTTQNGGSFGQGTVYQISTSGVFTVLHSFSQGSDGRPFAALIQASDGNLYGTTQNGGSFGGGTIFKMTTSGVFTVLRSLNNSTDGSNSVAALVQASDGNLYGTTQRGGSTFAGTIFQITTGGTFTVLHGFSTPTDGGGALAALIQATDGNLYGTTSSLSIPNGAGTIFKITTGGTFTVIHQFNFGTEGSNSQGALIQASDGNLYGTTQFGGPNGAGAVFQSTTGGTVTVLHAFATGTDGTNPTAAVIQATDGNLWGTTQNSTDGAGTVFKLTLGGTETLVTKFSGNNEAANPRGTLVQQPDGNFYGTTTNGGPANFGGVFRITPSGTLTILRSFSGADGNANGGSENGLARASDGNLYGTAQNGGANGSGTIFQISAAGAFTLIRSFSSFSDGGGPQAGVIQATDGNLYGTTTFGGASGFGTIYTTPLNGSSLTVLRSFSPNDGTDGTSSFSRLVQASDGNFYGTSQNGGSLNQGTVFRITPGGVYTVLHEFNSDGLDGANPTAGLIQASDGNLWGSTNSGGIYGSGTIFRMTLGGALTIVHDFFNIEGSSPQTALIQGSDGNLYGTTRFGGPRGFGTVFKMTLAGDLTRLYAFSGGPDGANPQAGVVQGTDGNLYGTTSSGGLLGAGTVFRLGTANVTVPGDVDGDGKADPIIYRPSGGLGQFISENSSTNYGLGSPGPFGFGVSASDIPVVGDFDGDNRVDASVFRRSTGQWLVSFSSNNYSGTTSYNWGRSGDVPVAGDYDGDGKTDLAVFRPSTGQWFIAFSSSNYTTSATYGWGQRGDVPAPGDYDGDGKADLVVFRPSTGQWFIAFSNSNYATFQVYTFGQTGDVPVPGDYDGDHKTDVAVFRPANGSWFILTSGSGYTTYIAKAWGVSGDIPVPADYDGDGKIDIAVFQPSTGQWFIALSSTGYATFATYVLGTSTDIPVYAALALKLASVTDTTRASDFDGDRKTDVAVFRPSTGQWFLNRSSTGFSLSVWGVSTDILVPGDYDGDGKTDLAVFRPSTSEWFINRTTTGFTGPIVWGASTDIPVPGDYDGDGKTDVAVFRPSTGEWRILTSSSNFTTSTVLVLGFSGDKPVPGDYDGDGRTDPAVYRNGQWLMLLSSAKYAQAATRTWGNSTDVPVPGDYDGDGVTDIAVYRPSTGVWWVLQSSTDYTTYVSFAWGAAGDQPVPADYDGDGKTDFAVFRPSTGTWYLMRSNLGFTSVAWGISTDIPITRRQ
jgi:uncharacterized repeat protein (TIGR03803 family)